MISENRQITFAIIGDSAASGVGDSDGNNHFRGWAYYLAHAFVQPVRYINVARPGAKSDEVRFIQLGQILKEKPDITAVIVGGNDLLRNSFSPTRLSQNIRDIVRELREIESEILLLQLHDPTLIVPMPRLLARVLRRRVDAVNAVTESIAQQTGAILLRTREITNVYDKDLWHVDRMHPNRVGHQTIAVGFRNLLESRGWRITPIIVEPQVAKARRESMIWMIRNGTPWFLKRSVDLLPSATYQCALELIRLVIRRPEPTPFVLPSTDQSTLKYADLSR